LFLHFLVYVSTTPIYPAPSSATFTGAFATLAVLWSLQCRFPLSIIIAVANGTYSAVLAIQKHGEIRRHFLGASGWIPVTAGLRRAL
jgi:hypothetical protein